MEGVVPCEEVWRCRRHPSPPPIHGVCPFCLRERLLLLCPDCARSRPCLCSTSASSSSSSFSSSFGLSDLPRSSSMSGIGAIGRVSQLIEVEPAFRRSRSVAAPFARSRSVVGDPLPPARRGWVGLLWPFRWVAGKPLADASPEKLGKGKAWPFLSPIKAFRQRKTARIVEERSTLCHG